MSAAAQAGAKIDDGDRIDVRVELDTEPRVVEVPEDLAAASVVSPQAKIFYESLSYSNQRRHVLAIDDAKIPRDPAASDHQGGRAIRGGQEVSHRVTP